MIGNQKPEFIEKRRVELEKYLQNAYEALRSQMPREFVQFLHFDEYDRIFLLQKMAYQFATHIVHITDTKRYAFSMLEVHAISRRLSLPCHPLELTEADHNFSHVLDFCSHLQSIIIVPTKYSKLDALHCEDLESFGNILGQSQAPINTSNIIPANLHFNLNAFKNLKSLTLLGVPPNNVESLGELCFDLIDIKSIDICMPFVFAVTVIDNNLIYRLTSPGPRIFPRLLLIGQKYE